MIKKWLKPALVSVLGIVVVLTGMFTFMTSDVEYITKIRKDLNLQQLSETIFSGHSDYAFETCYSGDPVLPVALFKTPFKQTDKYVSNKDLLGSFSSDQLDALSAKANDDLSSIFNVAYKDIEKIDELPEVFWEGYSLQNKSGTEKTYNNEETISLIHKMYMDDHVSLEASSITDKSLVFYDNNMLIVRAMLYVTPYECDSLEKLSSVFGIEDMALGESYSKMIEVSYVTMGNGADIGQYHVAGFRFL